MMEDPGSLTPRWATLVSPLLDFEASHLSETSGVHGLIERRKRWVSVEADAERICLEVAFSQNGG